MKNRLILFVKAPAPGKVKTRLVPPLSHKEAASLYRSWAREIYGTAVKNASASVHVAYSADPAFPTPQWLSDSDSKVNFFVQQGHNLGDRMGRAFERAFGESCEKVILIGTDSPGLPAEYINEGFKHLDNHDLVLGPTPDGGYYLIGLKNNFRQKLFEGVQWSTATVLEQTLTNARTLGLHKAMLPEYFDVDRPEDLERIGAGKKIQKFSVIIPVRNESRLIRRQIELIRQTSTAPTEIIVVDGQSSDGTGELAKSLADIAVQSARAGRGGQMALGAERASGDILLFLHADTRLPANWQEILLQTFGETREPVSGAAFELSFDSGRWEYRVIEYFARLRNWVTGVPYGDQGLAVRRNAYLSAGGFPDVPLMEEYFFVPRLREAGKFVTLKEPIKTSVRKYEAAGPFANAIKNSVFLVLFFLGVSPETLAKRYRKGDGHG